MFYYEDNDDDPILGLIRKSGNQWTWLDSEVVPVSGDTWLKCEVEGAILRTKVWPVGSAEPSGWDLEKTNSTYANGKSGILLVADRHVDVLIDDYSLEGVE